MAAEAVRRTVALLQKGLEMKDNGSFPLKTERLDNGVNNKSVRCGSIPTTESTFLIMTQLLRMLIFILIYCVIIGISNKKKKKPTCKLRFNDVLNILWFPIIIVFF